MINHAPITSIIAKNKPHALHESHLDTMKVIMILIPSFHAHHLKNAWDHNCCFVYYLKETACRL